MASGRRSITIAAIAASVAVLALVAVWSRGARIGMPSALLDRLAASALMIEREIEAELGAWEALAGGPEDISGLPTNGTLLVFDAGGVIRVKGDRPAYYPPTSRSEVPEDERLTRARTAEHKQRDLDAAIAAYREAATSTGRTVRATATAGLGRCLRAQHKYDDALAAYAELETMTEAVVDGIPAPYIAYHERRNIYQQLGDRTRWVQEQERLDAALIARNIMIEKAAFKGFLGNMQSGTYPDEPLERADALHEMWTRVRRAPSGRAMARGGLGAYAAVWRQIGEGSRAVVAPVEVLMKRAVAVASQQSVAIALDDEMKINVWGPKPARDNASHSLERIGLPVTLRLWIKEP